MFHKPNALLGFGTALLLLGVVLPHALPVAGWVRGVLLGFGGALYLGAFVLWLQPDGCDASTLGLRRRYLREFVPAMIAYVMLLSISLVLLKRIEEPAMRALVALLPVAPIAMVLRAIIRYIRDADELQRQIELEAVSIATALVSLLYMAGGFLQLAGVIGVPAGVAMIWMFPLVCMIYGLVKIVVARRFQ
ncbi:hypothetical protein IP90_03186 [Luteimonas cucumeris]|uniref:Uncharacterized protein n=1 Tax=Luteimonas cucumeris TaxID=985012 RepID=A0A562KV91_9GAMM|nr:hypothetical protein [Luteimonas cucumeris]TWH99195.1 hypothetical protein IP90_03186 [Luteimonas cucumeris]